VIQLLYAVFVAAASYQVLAFIACVRHILGHAPTASRFPGVSILKPVRGADADFYDAIRSHAAQDYPDFEMLFGVSNPADPAIPHIERLAKEFPQLAIRLIRSTTAAPNGKVGVLIDLAREARNPLLVVNDGDIRVPPGYLQEIVAPLANGTAGLVTCIYSARAHSFPARFEALGIATDFAPSALVAPMVGVNEFGMGSTLAFEAATLRQMGGFESVADYIADDYQIGKNISRLGKKVTLAHVTVETHLHGASWSEVWRHQIRWARTIRLSRPGGYAGLPIANASLWALVAACFGLWWWTAALLALRYAVGLLAAARVLHSSDATQLIVLAPVRDLWGFAVWLAALAGNTVEWGGQSLTLDREGRIRTNT
jgi:ceramide glucosyltransferase